MSFISAIIDKAERAPLPDVMIRAGINVLCSRTASRLSTGNVETDAAFAREMATRATDDLGRIKYETCRLMRMLVTITQSLEQARAPAFMRRGGARGRADERLPTPLAVHAAAWAGV